MFSWSSALVESALIGGVLVALALHAGLRATVMRAPLRLRLGMGLITTVWLSSQLAEVPLATYPLMSWHMYGESRQDAPVTGYRLLGETCAGESRVIPASGRELGRRPVLAFGITRAYHEAVADTTPLPARDEALARTDSLLGLVLETWNSRNPQTALCAVSVQEIRIAAQDIGHAPLPSYRTVRRHDRGR